jgi:GNAT superfamily N-acetyltransferase
MVDVTTRFDKGFGSAAWLSLFHAARYNEHWAERNAEAALAYAHLVVTAWILDELVGTLTVWSDGMNFAWIDDVVVHPGHREKGIGSALVEGALERLNENSIPIIQVLPMPGREHFYERMGFVVAPDAHVLDYAGTT